MAKGRASDKVVSLEPRTAGICGPTCSKGERLNADNVVLSCSVCIDPKSECLITYVLCDEKVLLPRLKLKGDIAAVTKRASAVRV